MNTRPDSANPASAPRWTTLAWLGALVLGLHLMLLGDGWHTALAPWPGPDASPQTVVATPPLPAAAATQSGQPLAPPAPPPRVHFSTVRWIGAAAPPAVEPARPAKPKPKPKPQPKPKPLPKPKPPPSALAEPPAPPTPPPADTVAEAAPPADAAGAAAPAEPTLALAQEAPRALPIADDTVAMPLDAPPPEPRNEAAPPPAPPSGSPETALASTPPPEPPQPEPLPAAQPPASTQLAYDVTGNVRGLNYSASGTLAWTLADGRYSARMEVRLLLLGSRVQTSAGRVDASGLLPERFSDKSRTERATHFDHTQRTIRFSNNRPEATLQPGAQDRLSLFMQLAGLLSAQPTGYPEGQLINLQVAGTSDAETWRFRVGPTETLALPAGTLSARHLVREARQPRDSRIDIWLAPELAYLPVRIRITQDNGDHLDQQLSQRP